MKMEKKYFILLIDFQVAWPKFCLFVLFNLFSAYKIERKTQIASNNETNTGKSNIFWNEVVGLLLSR